MRDGRPNASAQSQSYSLPFIPSQTLAGAVRSRLGSDEDGVFTAKTELASLKKVSIRGPLLARMSEVGAGTVETVFVPPPKDAVLFGPPEEVGGADRMRRIVPQDKPSHVSMDLDLDRLGLRPLGLDESLPDKPKVGASWWTSDSLLRWLVLPGHDPHALGLHASIEGLPRDRRVHVAMDLETSTASDGKLFQTDGLSFIAEKRHALGHSRLALEQYTLVATVSAWTDSRHKVAELTPGFGFLGGEKRWVRWSPLATPPRLASPPVEVQDFVQAGAGPVVVRVVLLTAAWFEEGWRPSPSGPLLRSEAGVTARLIAARVDRPETISGWDFEKGGPKPTRRLVPAGCVYWVELSGSGDARKAWLERQWLQNISDGEQERADGLGLAVVGVE